MAIYSLSDFFSERHACTRYDLNKAIIAAVTGLERRAVLAMFRRWYPSTNFSHVAFKRLALSKPEPLTHGQINPNVTRVRKGLEDLACGRWRLRGWQKGDKTGGEIVIPPMPAKAGERADG